MNSVRTTVHTIWNFKVKTRITMANDLIGIVEDCVRTRHKTVTISDVRVTW
jgi:hypothetical protein